MSSTSTSWNCLPYEIRLTILEILSENKMSLSRYASVCREWQQTIERKTFRQLKVTPSCLTDLYRKARSRAAFIRCIKFSIPLLTYNCSQCNRDTSQAWVQAEVEIVENALRGLFDILSTWESSNQALTLDIAIFSPSDGEHYFKNWIFNDTQNLEHRDIPLNDARHRWQNGRHTSLPGYLSQYKICLITDPRDDFWEILPQVPAVTCLQLRRQTRRPWRVGSIQQLLHLLPTLQTFYYEPWLDHIMGYEDPREGFVTVFEALSSGCVSKVVIFEDFNLCYDEIYRENDDMYGRRGGVVDEVTPQLEQRRSNVGGALAQASLALESLSVSFIVDARYFFKTCSATWVWKNLHSLLLTSRALVPGSVGYVEVNDMLRTAATVATRMPKLDTMVVWNYKHNEAVGAFIYQASAAEQWARVTWRATWDVPLQPSMIQLWTKVALERASSGLLFVKELLQSEVASQPLCETLVRLKLPCEVAHPESVLQMQREVLN